MTKLTTKQISNKLYRDQYKNNNGYHEIYYIPNKDKISIAFLFHNSWSQDRSDMIYIMKGYITPKESKEIAQEVLREIKEQYY